tara:strand:- start:3186 stop:3494 length:309 start_codon:yes stop_codon:yes gene_type:complete
VNQPKKTKEPKKTLKAIESLHKIVDQLKFFYGNDTSKFRKDVLDDAIYVEDTLRELGVDKKIDHARFATKFKNLFNKENKELKKENKELKKELKELKEKNET